MAQFENKGNRKIGRHPERSRSSGGAKDLLLHNIVHREIPRPAGEYAGLRNDAVSECRKFKLNHYLKFSTLDVSAAAAQNNSWFPRFLMLPYLFVLLAIAVRFLPFAGPLNILPHAWHFTPVAASLLYFGARGSRRRMWVPLVLLAATDVVLTKFVYAYPLSWDHLVTWAWYVAILWLGTNLREKSGPVRVVGAALASSVSFFLISNFAVWAAWPQMYPRTLHGLMMSYAAGLPFFRGTAESDLFFSIAMFGTPVFLHALAGWMHKSSTDHIAAA